MSLLKRSHLTSALGACAVAFLVVACGTDTDVGTEAATAADPTNDEAPGAESTDRPVLGDGEPEVSELSIGVIPIAGLSPIQAAITEGFFEDEGLEVTLEQGSGGAASLPLVQQGDLQISNAPPVSVALGQEQGFDFVILPPALDGTSERPGQTAVLVRDDGEIEEFSDLEGKQVAVNTINSVNWLYNRALLQQEGADIDEVTYTEVPFPSMIDALLNGSVDAIDVPQPFHHIGLETGETKALGYTFADVQPGLHITAFAATREWIEQNPNTVGAFVRAMTRAVEFLEEDESQARDVIVDYTGAERDLVDEIPIDPWSTEISISGVQRTIDLMLEEGLVSEKLRAEDFIYEPIATE